MCLWLLAGLAGPALAGSVTIVEDPDVDQAAVEAVDRAVATTLDLFREEFGLSLDHDVKLVLTASRDDFAAALVRQGGHSRDDAANRADRSVGLSSKGKIVEDLGRQRNLAEKIFVAAHELTHQFQDQAGAGRHNAVRWISEGVADYVAAKAVESAGLGRVADYRARWARQVAATAARPQLAALHGHAAWTAAESRFGGNIIYRLGDLAVLQLVDMRGEQALFHYFRKLRDRDVEQAFREAFGQDLAHFEQQAE